MLDRSRKRMIIDRHVAGDPASHAGNRSNQVYEDRDGAIWVCTQGGLSRLVRGAPNVREGQRRFKNYLNDRSFTHPRRL
jgi:hypothetical protein